ncbi:phenylalanine-tRNA ligase [Sporothrix schenckii ATCC 58251]|uniref:Phenylalanine--tRNA ligase, mitochondrial n=1 Tax=Sporothrix schenckii (strain ATCC 58251 / de Perez 2211183) TaxID=1391915 RepID=U7PLF2_SPOS1|nr:phenylalanine-tRNA ligase [Sporothrix schenckii ATCC 58251]
MAAAAIRMPRPMALAAARSLSTAPVLTRQCFLRSPSAHLFSTTVLRFSSSSTSSSSSPAPPPSVEIDGHKYNTDKWFNTPANVVAAASRRLHMQEDHPVAITRQIIESRFPAPTFRYVNSLHPVVSTFQNFDSLGFPADHPGRARSDTYYINEDTLLRTHTSAHELETFRANASPGFLLSADVYRRDEVDRTHYPVFHQMEGARVWDRRTDADKNGDLTAAILADLETLPRHGIAVEDPDPPFHDERNPRQAQHSPSEVEALGRHLKRSLELMVVEVFTRAKKAAVAARGETSQAASASASESATPASEDEPLRMRWVEAYFPFTSPSWELEVYYEGDWLEVLGCGISKHSILDAAGVPSQMAWAFGIGLDRIAMLLFQITDIRLFWSQDERFLSQFRGVSADLDRLRQFVPFSKYPECYKDVSFWVAEADAADANAGSPGLHSNDVMEVIRSVAGDVVEDVKLIDDFTHPKTKKQSLCYRINYRSLERTLTNAETNRLHDEVTDALVQRLGVEIR